MSLIKKIKNRGLYRQLIRYFVIASVIALLEVIDFVLLNSVLHVNYITATVLSVFVSIILNWMLSQKFVFQYSRFTPKLEFVLVAIASLIGMAIQVATIYIAVEYLHIVPIAGKIFALVVVFSWNFLSRRLFIFRRPHTVES